MADLSVTAASVVRGTSGIAINRSYRAGATITAGQTVYLDGTTGTWKLADCNASSSTATVGGIALHAAASGQRLAVQYAGPINPGATTVVGTFYVLSGTAGGIAPLADLATGDRVSVLGIADTAAQIQLNIQVTGVVKP